MASTAPFATMRCCPSGPGGLGNDWTPVRALGSYIKGTNGKSQGVVPFLKVVNDTAVAVNQCFDPETRVHTADGVKALRDVAAGDLVLGQRGAYREVRKTFAYNQTDPMVEVRVKHSIAPLKVTAGHPLWAIRGIPMEQAASRSYEWLAKGKTKPEWVDAGNLRTGDYVAQVIPQEVGAGRGIRRRRCADVRNPAWRRPLCEKRDWSGGSRATRRETPIWTS